MMTPLLLTVLVLAVLFTYAVLAPFSMNLGRFFGRKQLHCPSRHTYGAVRLNAMGAALSAGYGMPQIQVRACSLLGRGETCGEDCLREADL